MMCIAPNDRTSRSLAPPASSARSCCGSAPGIRRCAPSRLFGDSQAGAALAEVHPHLALAYPGRPDRTLRCRPLLDGIGLVFAALPHGHSQALAPRDHRARHPASSISAPISASTTPPPTSAGITSRTRRRRCSAGSSTAFPSSTATPSPPRATVAAAGCYPTSAILALKPLLGADRSGHDHRRRRLRRQRRRQGAEGRHPFQQRRREYDAPTACSITATPPRWRWRLAARCCSRRIWRR